MRNALVKHREKIANDDEEAPHNSESSSDKKISKGESCGTNLWKNQIT